MIGNNIGALWRFSDVYMWSSLSGPLPFLGIWTADSSSMFEWVAAMPEGQMLMVNMEGNSGLALYSISFLKIQRKQKNTMLEFFLHFFL